MDNHNKKDESFIDWPCRSDIVSLFEIPTSRVKKFLPKEVQVLEVRPNVALLWVALCRFKKNCLGFLPEFSEPNICIVVQNDFKKMDPTGKGRFPFISFYTLNVTANNEDFLHHAKKVDKMPVYHSHNLEVDFENYDVKVKDDQGPIFDLSLSYKNFKKELFENKELFIQVYTKISGKLHYLPVMWYGKNFETQKKNISSKLYEHPFFKGLEVSDLDTCYMQTIIAENEAFLRFYPPIELT